MSSIQTILNKIASMANRTGLFSIEKSEFFGTLIDITKKVQEVNNNVNSVAKSLIWQSPVATYDDLATAYPAAVQGWAAMVIDEGLIYSFNGALPWKNTGLTAFPADVITPADSTYKKYEANDPEDSINIADNSNPVLENHVGGGGLTHLELLENFITGWWSYLGYQNTGNIWQINHSEPAHRYADVILSNSAKELNRSTEVIIQYRLKTTDITSRDAIFETIWLNKKGDWYPRHTFLEMSGGTNQHLILMLNNVIKLPLNGYGATITFPIEGNIRTTYPIKKLSLLFDYQNLQLIAKTYDDETLIGVTTWQLTADEWAYFDLDVTGAIHTGEKFIKIHTYNANMYVKEIDCLLPGVSTAKFTETIQKIVSSTPAVKDGMLTATVSKSNQLAIDNSNYSYKPKTTSLNKKYTGQVSPKKRYLACGFDDFRSSDVSWLAPLFEKYGFKATFNKINSRIPTDQDVIDLYDVALKGHEIGDHTILHEMFIYYSPFWNGQNPASPEGTQVAFPTNNDFRQNRGDGKNVFGKALTDTIVIGYLQPDFGATTWATLSDAHCQQLREWYSVIKNQTIINYLDQLSNDLLGTSGSSVGSWSVDHYAAGIFTGCKTSANNEIWERVVEIQKRYFKKYFGLNQDITEWSLPGSKNAYLYFEFNGKFYYDRAKTQLANDFGKITNGDGVVRSWAEILRNNGYRAVHDSLFPGRNDGVSVVEMSNQFTINSKISKIDGIHYPTRRDVDWYGSLDYPDAYLDGVTDVFKKLYDDTVLSGFRNTIESIRKSTARGIIAGSVWDSSDDFSEKLFWEHLLKFCRKADIELVTMQEACDIAFNHVVTTGNLLYNPNFDNLAKLYIPTATNVPAQPDGWEGDCTVISDATAPDTISRILKVNTGSLITKHYGVPTGRLRLGFQTKGIGSIQVSYLRNKQAVGTEPSGGDIIQTIAINNANFTKGQIDFIVKDEPAIVSTLPFDGLDNKICGIHIKLTGNNMQFTMPYLRLLTTED